MFSWYKYLIVGLVFSRLGFWSGNLFLIAPFPDLCLLVPFFSSSKSRVKEGQRPRVILIENETLNVPNKSEIVHIEAITPVQRQNEKVESELLRMGSLKKKKLLERGKENTPTRWINREVPEEVRN